MEQEDQIEDGNESVQDIPVGMLENTLENLPGEDISENNLEDKVGGQDEEETQQSDMPENEEGDDGEEEGVQLDIEKGEIIKEENADLSFDSSSDQTNSDQDEEYEKKESQVPEDLPELQETISISMDLYCRPTLDSPKGRSAPSSPNYDPNNPENNKWKEKVPLRLSPYFGFYCPVLWTDTSTLVGPQFQTSLSDVVEFKGYVYVFSSRQNAEKFIKKPTKYTLPVCTSTPPSHVPIVCRIKTSTFEALKLHWGFMDFDPVRYYDTNHSYKGLQRGEIKFCVAYRNKIYCFISQENMQRFMRKPEIYWNQALPIRPPGKTDAIDSEKSTSYSYLIDKGVLPELKKVIQLTGEMRPKVPFMNIERCSSIFMGYYFKSQNINNHSEVRQKYRNAMFDMVSNKARTKEFLTELQDYYGCRLDRLPERLKTQMDEFLKTENLRDGEKVLLPDISGYTLSRDTFARTQNDFEITAQYQKVKQMLFQADLSQKIGAFDIFSARKRAEEEVLKEKDNKNKRNEKRVSSKHAEKHNSPTRNY